MNEQCNWSKNHKIGNSLIGIKTDILSRTVSELSQLIVQIVDIRLNDLRNLND